MRGALAAEIFVGLAVVRRRGLDQAQARPRR